MLIFTQHSWGNHRKADMNLIETAAEKKMLSVNKKLIESDEYKNVKGFQNAVFHWVKDNAVPSFFLRGSYLCIMFVN